MKFDDLYNKLMTEEIVLEGKKDKYVLFIKRTLYGKGGRINVVYQLKPFEQLTKEEKNIIKNDMGPSWGYKNGYDGSDIMGYDEVTVLFGSKKDLIRELKGLKDTYDSVKEEIPRAL
jgi:hypothetical protein